MTKSELSAFVNAIEAISVAPPQAATETVRPAILNPSFWFILATQGIMLYMTHSDVHGVQFEQLFFVATGLNLAAMITCLLYDKIVVHLYRVSVQAAPGAKVSPLRAAQLRALNG